MDFTFKTYDKLLKSLLMRGFSFMTFAQYIEAKSTDQQINEKQKTNQQINKSTTR